MTSYNLMLFYYKSLDIVHHDLLYKNEELGDENILFENAVSIKNLNFEYEKGKEVFSDISLNIRKGEKIAFVGESGSGKSTLVDIIMGLYRVKSDAISIDGVPLSSKNLKSWRRKVGYIPQSVYLFDGTVGENIAFGFKYDENRVIEVIKKAKIYDFLVTKELEQTLVGEGGVLLSGGQKQRIAIARALYANPEILVLDEATSALDDETEREIMKEIYSLSEDKTLIIIAHRLTTLTECETIYRLQDGKLIEEFKKKG
jgi:ABC-type multidrug transport system fused ATPase/permease subunit